MSLAQEAAFEREYQLIRDTNADKALNDDRVAVLDDPLWLRPRQ
jgi:hypothetical protein